MKTEKVPYFCIALACFSMASVAFASSSVEPGTWTYSVTASFQGEMEYGVYVPKGPARKVYNGAILGLHGCKQDPQSLAELSRLPALADQQGLILVFPEQSTAENLDHCWNWFMPVNEARYTGEPALIMQALNETLARFKVARHHAYVVGISAGGAMANIVASCNPEVFSGVAILSGLEYGYPLLPSELGTEASMVCPSLSGEDAGSLAYSCSGLAPRELPKVILFQGDDDTRVYPCNSDDIFDQWVEMEGLAESRALSPDQAVSQEKQDPGRESYAQRDLFGAEGWQIRQILVHGMSHAWSGGTAGCDFSDPNGPDATRMMWDYFSHLE